MAAPQKLLCLDGSPLDFAALGQIGAGNARLILDPAAKNRVSTARKSVDAQLAAGVRIYGANTGVGAMKDVEWSQETLMEFNLGLIRAHHFGTGEPFSKRIVRTAIAIRLNTILTGQTGASVALADALLNLIEADVVPVVRRSGSIGCADIGLMGQIGTVLTGAGEAWFQGVRLPAAEALEKAGLKPLLPVPRDALTALSSNAIGLAAAADALVHAAITLRLLMATGIAAAGALGASLTPWRAAAVLAPGAQLDVGAWLCMAAQPWNWTDRSQVQDPLSLRMMPQIFGTALETLTGAGRAILAATGRADDNPVVVGKEVMTSGGSLPIDVVIPLQAAQIAVAHLARSLFNRCVLLTNGGRRDLPINLAVPGLVSSGFGPALKLAGDLFTEILSLTAPVSPQPVVVAGGIEDEASFLPLVVKRLQQQGGALRRLTALEAIFAAQAIDICGDAPVGTARLVYDLVRSHCDFYTFDRALSAEIEAVDQAMPAVTFMESLVNLAPFKAFDEFYALQPAP